MSAWSAAALRLLICADERTATSAAVSAPASAAVSAAIWAGVKAAACAVDRAAMSEVVSAATAAAVSAAICTGVSAAICAGVIPPTAVAVRAPIWAADRAAICVGVRAAVCAADSAPIWVVDSADMTLVERAANWDAVSAWISCRREPGGLRRRQRPGVRGDQRGELGGRQRADRFGGEADGLAAVNPLSASSAAGLRLLICADERAATSAAVSAPVWAAVSAAIRAGVKASACAVDRAAMSDVVSASICGRRQRGDLRRRQRGDLRCAARPAIVDVAMAWIWAEDSDWSALLLSASTWAADRTAAWAVVITAMSEDCREAIWAVDNAFVRTGERPARIDVMAFKTDAGVCGFDGFKIKPQSADVSRQHLSARRSGRNQLEIESTIKEAFS